MSNGWRRCTTPSLHLILRTWGQGICGMRGRWRMTWCIMGWRLGEAACASTGTCMHGRSEGELLGCASSTFSRLIACLSRSCLVRNLSSGPNLVTSVFTARATPAGRQTWRGIGVPSTVSSRQLAVKAPCCLRPAPHTPLRQQRTPCHLLFCLHLDALSLLQA